MALTDVCIHREWVRGRGITQDHALACPDHGVEQGFGKVVRCYRALSESDLDRFAVDAGLGFDLRRAAAKENE